MRISGEFLVEFGIIITCEIDYPIVQEFINHGRYGTIHIQSEALDYLYFIEARP
jgi:hypothetical protein